MKPQINPYELYLATQIIKPKRSVLFLISAVDNRITAYNEFKKLPTTSDRHLRARFDSWVDGNKNNPRWYHGWDKSEFSGKYTACFVFKCKENKKQRRLYGFLCNPKDWDRGYQACILVCHDFKNEHETHENNLKTVEEIRTMLNVQRVIKDFFKEKENGCPLDRKKH